MAEGFVQLLSDANATGKQLDNDVVQIPTGTIVTDNFGNQTVLSAPAYYFRERVVNADPNDPKGVASVRNDVSGLVTDYGLTVRSPIGGITDLQTIAAQLSDIATNIAALMGTIPGSPAQPGQNLPTQSANFLYPVVGIDSANQSPGVPRRQVSDIFGRAVTVPYASRESIQFANLTITSTTASQNLIPGNGPFGNSQFFCNDLIAITAINTSATATELDISDGIQSIYLYLPAGDVRGISLGGVIAMDRSAGLGWTATTLTSVASVKIWVQYVVSRVT